MGCCGSKGGAWDMEFKETDLSSNKCDAIWEKINGDEATFGMAPHFSPCGRFGILPGVIRCRVGFAGGSALNPTYEDMGDCTLAINIEYDPKKTTFEQLLDVFWNYHDIFLLSEIPENQSTIYYHSNEQKQSAEIQKEKEQTKHEHEIVTVIKPFTTFIPSDEDHQHFVLQSQEKLMKYLSKRLKISQMAYSHLASRLEGYVSGYASPEDFDKELPELFLPDKVAGIVRSICVQNQIPEPGADHMNDWG